MHYSSFYFIIYSIVFLSCIQFSNAGNNDTDREALLQIKSKINDPLGALDSWNHSIHFCNWDGVTCGRKHPQRVTVLDLRSSKLSGSLSPYIGNLSFLRDLVLQNNSFSGTLPPQIGRLGRLQLFFISINSFGGEIPSNISSCSQLTQLSALNNKLVGSIPDELGSLLNLEFLQFYSNKLTGSIPSSLGNLSSLSAFSISYNNIVGNIPNSFGRLKNLARLGFFGNKLSGIVPSSIFNLSCLTILDFGINDLQGSLPSDMGVTLPLLNSFSIEENLFSGFIPTSIFNLSNLEHLDLSLNKLDGSIPDSFGTLENLTYLDLSSNQLTSSIPNSFGTLENLTYLDLSSNQLTSSIPNSFGTLENLTYLDLSSNQLAGNIPSSIFNLSCLTTLDLGLNDFEGRLPSNIGVTLPLLNWLSLYSNRLSGVIPTSISNLSNLDTLALDSNSFQGKVPSLKNLVNLKTLLLWGNSLGNGQNDDLEFVSSLRNSIILIEIGENNFSGNIPEIICNFTALQNLALWGNKITGVIPICIGNLVNLQVIDISENQISGTIPENLGKLHNLEGLYMGSNQLSGYIPSSIGNLTKLLELNLSRNNLEGQIPSSIGNCSRLLAMDLSHNNFNGSIPSELLSISALSIGLYLNDNHFNGTLDSEVGQLNNLVELDISSNKLTGVIPNFLSTSVELEILYMSHNFFHGAIPDALKTLTSLKKLNLSWNNLTGKIPEFLVNPPLIYIDLSYNQLRGEVPLDGVFGNSSEIIIIGNDLLCGGIPELELPKCMIHKTHVRRSIIFGLLGTITLVTFAILGTIWYRNRSTKAKNATATGSLLSCLSYQSLLKATNGFSTENLIGSGTFGFVYKGIVDLDEALVAIKVFKLEHHGAAKSFMAECGVLRNIRHRNLVKVITVCSSIDYQGNDFKALVYEYMVNGSLEDWLHPDARSVIDGINHVSRSLNFVQRLNIAVDVALAVEYLHYGYGESIVHCDLKPSNILLDEDMVAHVNDFGLAKFLSTSQAFQSSSLGFMGTVGYAPPEYGLGNEVSTNGDVYSFGILLMELVTGKRPTSDTFRNGLGLSLRVFVQVGLPENVTGIIDEALLEDAHAEDTENRRMRMEAKILEASSSMLGLALSCSAEIPQDRLNIKEVVSELTAIRKKFYRTL